MKRSKGSDAQVALVLKRSEEGIRKKAARSYNRDQVQHLLFFRSQGEHDCAARKGRARQHRHSRHNLCHEKTRSAKLIHAKRS